MENQNLSFKKDNIASANEIYPTNSILTGTIAGIIIFFITSLINKLKPNHSINAIATQLLCGIQETLAVGLFSNFAGTYQLFNQLTGVDSYSFL